MKITEHNNFTEKSYQIIIKANEELDPFEIVECFKSQYPKEKAVICFAKEKVILEVGILIVGLNLKWQKKKKVKSSEKEKN